MTAEKAIKELKWIYLNGFRADPSIAGTFEIWEAIDTAIKALEKQVPKKPIYRWDGDERVVLCPHCKKFPFDTDYYKWARKFCGHCGQAILWEGE